MLKLSILLIGSMLSFVSAKASTITFDTPLGATVPDSSPLPVSASATFTTLDGVINVTLYNTFVNPTSVAQNVSDLIFYLSTGENTGTLSSSSSTLRTVASGGTYTSGGTASTGWDLQTYSTGLILCVICSGSNASIGPAHTLIGEPDSSGLYSNAGGSIAGNGPHNPFLYGPTTFSLSVPGVTADSTITAAMFSFGTTFGTQEVPGDPTPEPGTLLILGSGLIGLALLGKRRRDGRKEV